MNCGLHPDRPAVAVCENCGDGICEECYNETHWMGAETSWAEGDLCLECYADKICEEHNEYLDINRKRKKRIIISCITYIIGFIVLITGIRAMLIGEPFTEVITVIGIGIVLCGIYTGLTWHKAVVLAREEEERKHGATYVIDEDGIHKESGIIMKLIFFIIGVSLGVIWTPIRIIIDAVNYKKDKRFIENCDEILQRISHM